MTHRASVWLGACAGGLGLLAVSWSAAPAARAQESAEDLACIVFEELINSGLDFCLEEGCEPSEKDCDKLCKNGTKTCNAISKDSAKLADEIIKAESKQQKTLCKTADDPKTCKSDTKTAKKAAKMESKQFRKDAKAACKSSDLVDPCLDACNSGLACFCDGPDLICGE